MKPHVKAFFDEATFTVSYVVQDEQTLNCAIVDSVLDYDPKSGRTSTASADAIAGYITDHGLTVDWILETHVHADHLTAAPYLQDKLGGKIGIGSHITDVQTIFKKVFNANGKFKTNGGQFDRLFKDGDKFKIGKIEAKAMHTPGHTPACMTYLIGDAAFVGDTLFMPDYGTARCDFPGGDAATLYASIQSIFALPDETRLFMCHDYLPPAREDYRWETSVADEKKNNIHVHKGVSKEEFVKMRTERDASLDMPVLILPSVQVNMRAGHFPPPEDNGVSYLKIPLNQV